MRLFDKLYTYVWQGKDNNCNSYLFPNVLKDGNHLLVDPGHTITPSLKERSFDRVAREMERDGLDAGAIGLIVLTHAHSDHCEAANIIREQNRALVALNELDEPLYRRVGGKVDVHLEEGNLVLGGEYLLELQIFHSPGHSPGHVTIYWPGEKVLITGDVIFYQATGRVDLPGGDLKALRRSIERLSHLDTEYMLCGHPYGHPGVIKGKSDVQRNFELVKANILT
jgi:glyoxylase-like metal-dependent hydrolase (beta-lactamase superfamily II)